MCRSQRGQPRRSNESSRSVVWRGVLMWAAWCGVAHAQEYPNKLVRFIVTYPPGGSSDVMARIIGQKLTEYWGQVVLVDSRPGADGSIGMEYAAKQPPTATRSCSAISAPSSRSRCWRRLYDWQKDFAPVSRITNSANILVVPVTLPVKNTRTSSRWRSAARAS